MEKQLFDWASWDEMDSMILGFFEVTLKTSIGRFKAGTYFESAVINFEQGTLELTDEDNNVEKFNLRLEVVE